jgi:hypothetical protein
MALQLSLCIPTMRRWNFLKENIPKYLVNPYIKEIVIVDETGEDYDILSQVYQDEPKLRLFKNETRLGPFLNKVECMKKASCEWICLMDSDNFADLDYFEGFSTYTSNNPDPKILYCPSFAKPHFDYRDLENILINKYTIRSLLATNKGNSKTAFNTGNYIFHINIFYTIQTILLSNNDVKELSKQCYSCDVIYMNYLLLQNSYFFVFVPKMYYSHVVHDGSIYLATADSHKELNHYINDILFNQL